MKRYLSVRKLIAANQHWCKGHHAWEASTEFDINPVTGRAFNRCRRCESGQLVNRGKKRS